MLLLKNAKLISISIHALREEGDPGFGEGLIQHG